MQPNFDAEGWEKEDMDKGVTLQCYEEESEDAMKDVKDEVTKATISLPWSISFVYLFIFIGRAERKLSSLKQK